MSSTNEEIFEKFSNRINTKVGIENVFEFLTNNKNLNVIDNQEPKFCDYVESYDTGLIFSSITDVVELKKFRKDFYQNLKTKIYDEFKNLSHLNMDKIKFSMILSEDKQSFIKIHMYSNDFWSIYPTIYIDLNGLVYTKFESLNLYTNDVSFAPHSLFVKSKVNPFGDIDDLPITAKVFENAINNYFSHLRYDIKTHTFMLDDAILFGGLSKDNIFSRLVNYLIEKYTEFVKTEKSLDFKVFNDEIENRLNAFEDWFKYGSKRQKFLNETENNYLEEKRPAEFFRDFIDVIDNKSTLCDNPVNLDDILNNRKKWTLELLNILKDIYPNDTTILSPEASMLEYFNVIDNTGEDPLIKIANVLEGYFNFQSNFTNGLCVSKIIYKIIDETALELKKTFKKFFARDNSNKKGLSVEDYLLVIHEKSVKNQSSFLSKLNTINAKMTENYQSLLRVSDKSINSLLNSKTEKISQPVNVVGNILIHTHNDEDVKIWNKKFFKSFKFHSLNKAIDNAYNNLEFLLSQLVKSEVLLKEEKSKMSSFINLFNASEIGYNLELEYETVLNRLEMKKKLKEEDMSDKKENTILFLTLP